MDVDDSSFKKNYKIDIIDQRVHAPSYDFSWGTSPKIVLSLRITSNKNIEWIGNFHEGIVGHVCKFLTTPSPDIFCAVIHGIGYWIDVNRPENYAIIKAKPVISTLPIPLRNIIIFVDYNDLYAYDESGFIWSTNHLSFDGIEIIEYDSDKITAKIWIPPEYKYAVITTDGVLSYL